MSLFRAREWWSTKVGEREEFDKGSMALGNVDNDPDENQMKVVTGSLQGMLRVHHPRQPYFGIEDLLLEQDLGSPILQVAVGSFIPAAPELKSIAVLHPRKLGVYTFEAVGGRGAKASYFDLAKAYEHLLGGVEGGHFTACNMTHGGFGGVSRDLLCVQSMDGRLQVFEQDAHAFTRRLNGILTPGPICYVARIDAFVVGNSEMGVDCYKYQALAASQGDREEGEGEGIAGARGLQAYWSCRLGEPAIDMFVAKFSRSLGPGCVDIVVLGERTLFTLREQGTIRLQKILGYQPACGCKYAVSAAPGEEGARLTGTTVADTETGFATVVEEENLIIVGDTAHLMVYTDMQLVWQAAVPRAPVSVFVAKFGGCPGLVCSLDDEGVLSACYQGTDPPTSAVVAPDAKEIDYDQMNQEHRDLLQVIRRSQTDSERPPAGRLTLQVHVPRFVDHPGSADEQTTTNTTRPQRPDLPGSPARGFDDDGDPSREMNGVTGESLNDASEEFVRRALPLVDNRTSSSGHAGLDGRDGPAAITVRFVVTYSGAGELQDATLNISPPSGFTADPSSVLLPPVRRTGSGDFHDSLRGRSPVDPCLASVVFRAECGAGRLPSTLLGHASVIYTRQSCLGGGGTATISNNPEGNGDRTENRTMSARCDVRLPLAMAARQVAVSYNKKHNKADRSGDGTTSARDGGAHKFTLVTSEPAVSLACLFEDMLLSQHQPRHIDGGFDAGEWVSSEGRGLGGGSAARGPFCEDGGGRIKSCDGFGEFLGAGSGNSVSTTATLAFRHWADGGVDSRTGDEAPRDVTVTVSKTPGEYGVQSSSFAAICVVATELVRRLKEYFGDDTGGRGRSGSGPETGVASEENSGHAEGTRLRIEYTEALPLSEFHECIDDHFESRKHLIQAAERLNAAAHQYRVIEKRLLARFKDRNPSPLDRLDVVSEETYLRLVDFGGDVQRAQDRLAVSASNLGCAVRLLALLMDCRFHLGRRNHELLLAHLHPEVTDTDDQGWEETVDAALTHLLRTTLAKVAKDSIPIPASGYPPLVMPEDTNKLKKHISMVCDRLNKGARLALRPSAPPSSMPQQTSPSITPPPSPLSRRQHPSSHDRK